MKRDLPPGLTPREAEIVEIVRVIVEQLHQEMTRDMRALWRELRDELRQAHRELYAPNPEAAAKAQREYDEIFSQFLSKQQ